MTRPRTSEHRKHIPIGVKLHSVLLKIGFTEEEIAGGIEWDHDPALGLRLVHPDTGEMVPHPNDPRFITPRRKAEHAVKTRGNGGTTAGSDIHMIAKVKRMERKRLAPDETEPRRRKRKIASRPFPKRERRAL